MPMFGQPAKKGLKMAMDAVGKGMRKSLVGRAAKKYGPMSGEAMLKSISKSKIKKLPKTL